MRSLGLRLSCLGWAFLLLALSVHAQAISWVGTWATAPMRGEADADLAGKTLRQIVRTSVGGDQLRIQISNLYGDHPLHVEDVHVSLHRSGSSTLSGSDHAVLFGGGPSVVVPPRSAVHSDAVGMKVPVLAELAISFYLPSQEGAVTLHAAHRTNYIADGDASERPDLGNAKQINSIKFLTNVDVRGRDTRGAVVVLGASITEGYSATEDSSNRWPDVLAERLALFGIGVLNEGISGNRLMADGAGPSAESRFERDVLDQPGVRWVIFSDDPINDLGSTRPPPSAAALIASIRRLIAKAHSMQIQFLCSTLTPYQGANYWRPEDEPVREEFNAFVRSRESGCDGVVDQEAATHDPTRPTAFLPAYDSGDHLHPNDAGHKAIGDAVNLSFFEGRVKPLRDREASKKPAVK